MTPEEKIAEFASAFTDLTNSFNATADSAAQALAKKKAAEELLVKSTVAAAAGMGNAAKGFIGAMAGGEGGAKSLGGFVDAAKDGVGALSGMAQSAVNASKKMGDVGKIAASLAITLGKGMSDALLDASKFFLGEVDALGKTFNEFGQIGALGSKGMQGLVDDFRTSGLMMTSYKKIVAENTTTFANFKGSVKGGITEFVNLSHELTNPDGPGTQLRMLGMSLEQVGEAGAAYMALQVKLGRTQSLSTADLTRGTIEYAKSLDEVAKLTGINKKTLEQEQQAALTANRFAAALDFEKNETVREEMIAMQQQSRIFGTFTQQGITDLMSSKGAALTEAAKATQLALPGIGQLLAQLGQGKKSEDIVSELQDREKLTRQTRRDAYRMMTDSSTDFHGGGAGGSQFVDLKMAGDRKPVNKQLQEIRGDALTTQTDKLTKDVVKSQQAFEDMYKAIQNEVINKLPFAASAIKTFADTANAVTKSMLNLFGSEPYAPLDSTTTTSPSGTTTTTNPQGTVTGTPGGAATSVMPKSNRPAPSSAPAAPQTRGFAQTSAAPKEPGSTEGSPTGAGGTSKLDLASISSKTGKSTQVASKFALSFQQLVDYLDNAGYDIKSLGGYNDRAIAGTDKKSFHAFGGAIDINPDNNPMGASLITDMPAGIGSIASSLGLGWGGNWKSKKDAMHFSAAVSEGGSLLQAANGGILSGPRSGYSATLHGTEAVVPLPDGRSIPVTNSGGGGSMEIQAAQLNALEELVSAMKNQVNISSKMLQYSQ